MSRRRKYPFHDLAPGQAVFWPWPPVPAQLSGDALKYWQVRVERNARNSAGIHARRSGIRLSVHASLGGLTFRRRSEP